jgi:hypothetical protein
MPGTPGAAGSEAPKQRAGGSGLRMSGSPRPSWAVVGASSVLGLVCRERRPLAVARMGCGSITGS